MGKFGKPLISALVNCLIVLPLLVSATEEEENDCGCSAAVKTATALKYKIMAIFSTLIVGVFGVCLPIFGLDLDNVLFSCVKSHAATVILAIVVVYILPDAKESLTSSCIGDEPPWGDFPMTGVVAIAAGLITMIESFPSAFMNRSHFGDKEEENQNGDQIHVHSNASQGHSHGFVSVSQHGHNNIRQKLVLELGILVHSVIIRISLGASPSVSVSTIKPLIAAVTFHQLFQGIGLGGRISQAKFELKKSYYSSKSQSS